MAENISRVLLLLLAVQKMRLPAGTSYVSAVPGSVRAYLMICKLSSVQTFQKAIQMRLLASLCVFKNSMQCVLFFYGGLSDIYFLLKYAFAS